MVVAVVADGTEAVGAAAVVAASSMMLEKHPLRERAREAGQGVSVACLRRALYLPCGTQATLFCGEEWDDRQGPAGMV